MPTRTHTYHFVTHLQFLILSDFHPAVPVMAFLCLASSRACIAKNGLFCKYSSSDLKTVASQMGQRSDGSGGIDGGDRMARKLDGATNGWWQHGQGGDRTAAIG